MSLADYLRQTQVSSSPRYDIGKLKIQNGSGMAVNPRTGQLEQVYAMSPDDPLGSDYSKLQFASDGPLDEGVQSLAGWAPGYYTDKPSTFDNFMERGTLAGLMAIGGAAFGGAGLAGEASGLAGEAGVGSLAGSAAADTLGGEAALGGGLSTGAAAGGIGGGATGSGLTAGATSGGIGAGAGAATGAGLGTFAGETAYPVFGGATGAVTGSVGGASGGFGTLTAGGAAAGGTALSRIMSGNGGASDWLSIAGALAPSVLGAYASNKQANSLSDLADKYMAIGGPSRARYEASYAPGFTMASDPGYTDALNQTTKATLHGLSVNGNPAGSPNAWEKTLSDVNQKFAYPALASYRNQNAATGGYGAFSTAAPGVATGAIGAERGIYDSLGAGAANIFNPPQTLSDLLHAVKSAGY